MVAVCVVLYVHQFSRNIYIYFGMDFHYSGDRVDVLTAPRLSHNSIALRIHSIIERITDKVNDCFQFKLAQEKNVPLFWGMVFFFRCDGICVTTMVIIWEGLCMVGVDDVPYNIKHILLGILKLGCGLQIKRARKIERVL